MNTKINLSQLAKILAQMKNMSQKDAEAFLREFFDAIIQNVTTDKLVKIKGLGTFKLIEVLERESVNVNTGERIVIPGHTKMSFTPDTSLKDMVNKPFADFQTVVINEGTDLEEMERIPQEEEESELVPVPEPETELETEKGPEPTPVSSTEPMLEPGADTKMDTEVDIPSLVASTLQSPFEPSQQKHGHSTAKNCAYIVCTILLCILCFYVGHETKYVRETKSEVQENKPKEQASKSADTLRPTPTPIPPKEQKREETQYAQVPGGEYKIIGTRKTHVMKSGDYLTKIALEEYGDKEITRYIIVHNRFPDPNNVPIGAEIKLPELEKVQ